ncbi:MAG: LytR family transcriptional regulator [Firmicutes bacterium]|nr:LytR family transcriptional regulator [Bacillota bacterium]
MRRYSRSGYYRRRRRGFNYRRMGTILTVVVFLILIAASVNFFTLYNALRVSDSPTIWYPQDQERTQFLVLGSYQDSVTTASILSVPADSSRPVYLLNIPPETLVDDADGVRESLSKMFAHKGIEPVISSLDNLLGSLSVDYWLTYEFDELPALLESVQPLQITLEQGHSVTIDDTDYVFAAGANSISDTNVQAFAALADDSLSPEAIYAHNKLIVAVFNEVFALNNLVNMVDNLRLVNTMHDTNLSARELARFRDTLAAVNQHNSDVLLLPGRWLSADNDRFWSAEPRLVNLVVRQFLEDIPAYNRDTLVVDVYNGNGVDGFAGSSAENLRALEYQIGRVDNADVTQQTQIYYLPEYQLAALELALILDCEPALIEGEYNDSENPVSIILGKDLIGGSE